MCVGVLNFVHGKLCIKVHRHIVSCQLKLYSPFPLKIFEMLPKDLRKVPIVHIKNGDVCVCVIANGRSLVKIEQYSLVNRYVYLKNFPCTNQYCAPLTFWLGYLSARYARSTRLRRDGNHNQNVHYAV